MQINFSLIIKISKNKLIKFAFTNDKKNNYWQYLLIFIKFMICSKSPLTSKHTIINKLNLYCYVTRLAKFRSGECVASSQSRLFPLTLRKMWDRNKRERCESHFT